MNWNVNHTCYASSYKQDYTYDPINKVYHWHSPRMFCHSCGREMYFNLKDLNNAIRADAEKLPGDGIRGASGVSNNICREENRGAKEGGAEGNSSEGNEGKG